MKHQRSPRAKLFLLGSFELQVKEETIHLPTRKVEALLAYVVLHGHLHNREKIASMFWGDSPDDLARRSLRTALSALRKELGEDFMITDRETIKLNPDYPIWVDVQEMEKEAKDVLSANSQAVIGPNVYRGELLPAFYDEWILEEREHYRSLFINALLQSAQSLRTNGEYIRAIEISQKIISIDVANERAYQHLIFCYGMLGNRSAALKSYEDCRFQLQEKLGVHPAEDTNALYEYVKKSNSSGLHPTLAKSNLPIPLTSFIGREQELKTLKDIFGKTRLLTLTGVGGCGKTRLSLQLAAEIADQYADGVWWIGLASIQDEKLLAQSIKKTFGIPDSQKDSAEESMLKFLHARHALLVLDNCEHVISSCARLAESILMQCSGIRILATSREALSIHGEIAWLVPSLSLPPADEVNDLLRWECPRLFYERATTYRSDLQLTEANSQSLLRICRALEGIPLAIELAASRVKTLSLERLASRLDDKLALLTTGSRTAQPRQQTLRAAIDWSYDLLSETEQIAFRRLSILAGNWTLDAAHCVITFDELTAEPALDMLTRLLDKSLLVIDTREGDVRYRMLEIIRQYASEKLQQADEVEKVQHQHLRYYAELAQKVNPGWYGREQASLIKQFDAEYPNLRVALAHGLELPQGQEDLILSIKLASGLGPFWNFIAEYNEGQMWLKKAIDAADAVLAQAGAGSRQRTEFLSLKAKAMYEYGFLVWFQSNYDKARTIFLESSKLYEELKDLTGLAYSNMFLAHSTWGLGERDLARKMWAGSLEQFKQVNDLWGAGLVHSFVGRAEREAANYDQAEWEYNQCLQYFDTVGDDWGQGIGFSHLGMMAFQKNDPAKAMGLFEKRLFTAKKIGFRQSIAYSNFLIGMASWKLGNSAQVQNYMREALSYMYEISNFATLAECLLGLAWADAEQGNLEQAAYLLGAVTRADETEKIKMEFENLYFHQPVIFDLRSRLKDVNDQGAFEKGRNATLDQAAKEILET
jgi:predicted ATPase/DNA-binding SARP family transcriptional activator